MSRYVKTISAFFALLGTWGATAAADGRYDQVELWGITGIIVGSLAVYQFPNTPPHGERSDPNMSEQSANYEGHVDI